MDSVYRHLTQIVQPTDLHKLKDKELGELAREVRQAILDNVSRTGGHFSSNLGTVELTVAMYASYNVPPDKVIWDTGHQAYPHKLLTGRLDRFQTLRKKDGLSGFLKRDEHPLDLFGAGHAGTAISAALGFAAARDRMGTTEKVVAVAGDASIGSGMSWEALNHAGEMGTDITVVLNDNRMSIAPNVGALTNYLSKLRSRPLVQTLARRAKRVVERMPEPVVRMAAGFRHGITHYMAPEETGTIFEEFGFEYIGPVDGHDLPTLLEVFRNINECDYPVFVHAITVKGKGYDVAEEDARKWHGVVPFDLDAGIMAKSAGPVTFTQAFGDAIVEAAQKDDKVVAITAAMPDGTGLVKFHELFPDRFYDTGIAEQHAVTFAAGMAAAGLRPACAIYSTFLQRGFDQVLHDVCIQNLPVRFFLDRAGLVGDDGPTHHGVFDLSFLGLIPNLTILAPRDATELRQMVQWSMGYDEGPTAVRYPRGAGDDLLPESRTPIVRGQAEILCEGEDVVLCGIGSMVGAAWQAAKRLRKSGVEATVVNARFSKPVDAAIIGAAAAKTGRILTIEENVASGGFGQSVRDILPPGVEHKILALPDAFVEHGPQSILREQSGLAIETIVEWVLSGDRTMVDR
ncbi:MAG TPA: 1-deoxy-D-xylulose-5-phosphate synthase [Fimbriimonas sp.]